MPSLVAVTGPRAGARIELGSELVVGRSASCDVPLPDDGKVSRRHAKVAREGDRVVVSDLGSRNGTFVNGERICDPFALTPGDRVQVGETVFVVDLPVRASVAETADEVLRGGPVEEFLPAVGEASAAFRAATALLSCSSEAAALRRGAEEVLHLLRADAAAAFVPGEQGLVSAAVCGVEEVAVPRPLLRAASELREAVRTAHAAAAPLWAGGPAFGLLYFERREEPVRDADLALLGMVARLCGEAVTASRARATKQAEGTIIGTSRALRRTLELVRRTAGGQAPVLLTGEPGTGKALLAPYLHARSPRSLAPFVHVDCRGAAPLVEELLFGRPAVAGAPARLSAFAQADGGTLVLVAVHALPRELGMRVARVLRDRRAPLPAGGDEPSDFRLVATCRDAPARLAAEGHLDPELAAALDGEEIALPPLRERKGDIPLLFEYFAAQAARTLGQKPPQLSPEARHALVEHGWPGNVRELRSIAERLALVCPGEEILSVHLPREVTGGPTGQAGTLAEQVARLERDVIAQALRRARGKKIQAAALLGISRPTLDKKIAEYKLTVR